MENMGIAFPATRSGPQGRGSDWYPALIYS
jgi:hypothetical protein